MISGFLWNLFVSISTNSFSQLNSRFNIIWLVRFINNICFYYRAYAIIIGIAFPLLTITMNTLFSKVLGPIRQGKQQGSYYFNRYNLSTYLRYFTSIECFCENDWTSIDFRPIFQFWTATSLAASMFGNFVNTYCVDSIIQTNDSDGWQGYQK